MRYCAILFSLIISPLFSGSVLAQTPAPATPLYVGSRGGGFALTGGNTDTKNFNVAFGLVRDPKTQNVIKITALYLRGSRNDVLSLDRTSIVLRDECTLSGRTFLFAQKEYLRDQFRDIRYLIAPVGGLGYKVVNTDDTKFSVSAGAGGIWEKDSILSVRKSGSLNVGESFSHKLSPTATFTESIATLWKTNDFGDSLTNCGVGLTISINGRVEVKMEFLDSYKNKPPNPAIKKNDTAFVTTFVFRF